MRNLPQRIRNLLIAGAALLLLGLCIVLLRPGRTPPPALPPTPSPAPMTPTLTATPLRGEPAAIITPTPPAPGGTPATQAPGARPTVKAKAFPGAEGFGADAIGGRGGRVIEVTNLNDRGPGSFRECAVASGPRICIFKVGGTITLESEIKVSNPYLTIAGQTAPGGGIILRNSPTSDIYTSLVIRTHDVIVRYLTVRAGPSSGGGDASGVSNLEELGVYNIVLDHNSFSWGVDESFSTWRDVHDLSLQWNIFAEGLDCSTHKKGCHSKGVMLGSSSGSEENAGLGAFNMSFHHNLIANNHARNPLVKTSGVIDLVNNVSYNARGTFSMIDMESESIVPVNYVNNYFKAGPQTPQRTYGTRVDESKGGEGVSLYVSGNLSPSRPTDGMPDTDFVDPRSLDYLTNTRHAVAPVTTTSAEESYVQVLADAGNNRGLDELGRWYPRQDAVDRRIIAEVQSGTGKVVDAPGQSTCPAPEEYPGHECIFLTPEDYTIHGITDPLDADGWPIIAGGEGYPDADHDGMPDAWEQQHGFNPTDPSDGPQDADGDGFTNLEEFLNGE